MMTFLIGCLIMAIIFVATERDKIGPWFVSLDQSIFVCHNLLEFLNSPSSVGLILW